MKNFITFITLFLFIVPFAPVSATPAPTLQHASLLPARVRPTPESIDPQPEIAQILSQITNEMLYNYVGGLSGEWAISIGNSEYTLATRYSRAAIPIEKATQWVYEHFQSLGFSPTYHTYNLPGTNGGQRRNVIAEQPGTLYPNQIVLITAHLDSTSGSPYSLAPGADDNGSGSAAVIVAADLLSQHQFAYTIRYVLFTGEEQGLYGSAAYANDMYLANEQVRGVINLDMIAYNSDLQPILDLHTRPGDLGDLMLANLFKDVIAAYSLPLTAHIWQDAIPYSDHASFWDYGYSAILAIEDDDDFTPYYHTTNDQLETLNMAYFTAFTKAAIGSVAHLAVLQPEQPEEGNLNGTITAAHSGYPLEGAQVSAHNPHGEAWHSLSAADGTYSLTLPVDVYTVTIGLSGYQTQTLTGVVITGGESTTQNAALLQNLYPLTGTVTNAAGAPLAATVNLHTGAYTLTNPINGAYAFALPAGTYTVTAQASGYISQTAVLMLTGSGYAHDFSLESACVPAQILALTANVTHTLSGGSVLFTASLTGTQPITLTWQIGSEDIFTNTVSTLHYTFPLVSAPQTHTVSVRAANTCTVSTPQAQIVIRVEPYYVFLPAVRK